MKLSIQVDHDSQHANPRNNDNLGTMYCAHGRYVLGDEPIESKEDLHSMLFGAITGTTPDDLYRALDFEADDLIDDFETLALFRPRLETFIEELVSSAIKEHYITLPLYLYDHSGITMSCGPFSCPWDSGQVGLIVAKKGAENLSDEEIEQILRSEVEIYDHYLQGNVWEFVVYDGDEVVDSCCGFFGDVEDCGIQDHISNPDEVTEIEVLDYYGEVMDTLDPADFFKQEQQA